MATYINPDNNELIINGALSATSVVSSTATTLTDLTLTSVNDIDLNDIPSWTEVSDPTDPGYAPAAFAMQGGMWIGGNQYIGGTLVANGDVITLGNAGGSLTLNANISSDVLPSTDGAFDIGSDAKEWANVYAQNLHLNATSEDIVTTGPISATTSVSLMDGSTSNAVSLPDGSNGQIKIIVQNANPASVVVLTPDTPLGFTSITFSNAGETATLMYTNSGWAVLSNHRSTITI